MKKWLSILTCICSVSLYAQQIYWEEGLISKDSVNATHFLKLSAGQYINSNTIDNQFVDALFAGEELTEEIRTNTVSRLKTNNRLGSDTKFNLSYYQKGKKLNWGLKVNTRDFLNTNLTGGTVGLLLEGNHYKKGEKLDLSGSRFNYYSYNQYALLLEKGIGDNLVLGARLSYISAYTMVNVDFVDSYLTTDIEGTSIEAQIKGEITQVDSENQRMSFFNNPGGSIDIYAIHGSEKSKVYLAINNVGAISKKNGNNYVIDTSFVYSGVKLSGDLQLDSVFGTNSYNITDTLVNFPGVIQTQNDGLQFLPFDIQLMYQDEIAENLFLQAGLNHIFMANYIPKLSLNITKQFRIPLSTELLLSYGGYSNFDIGLGVNFRIANKITLFYKAWYLEDLIAPFGTSGQGNSFGVILKNK